MPLTITFQGKQTRGPAPSLKAQSTCRLAGGFLSICNNVDVATAVTCPESLFLRVAVIISVANTQSGSRALALENS